MSVFVIVIGFCIGLCIAAIIWCLFMLYRNNWVCKARIHVIQDHYDEYNSLPSYDVMLYRHIFTWDVHKYLKKGDDVKINE